MLRLGPTIGYCINIDDSKEGHPDARDREEVEQQRIRSKSRRTHGCGETTAESHRETCTRKRTFRRRLGGITMSEVKEGVRGKVIAGTHAGKSGVVKDLHTSKTGHSTITVVQSSGERFKTLAKNVAIQAGK
jgi:hypothetical protein